MNPLRMTSCRFLQEVRVAYHVGLVHSPGVYLL
jgi:hypothetical protein